MSDAAKADPMQAALEALRQRYKAQAGATLDAFRALAARLAETPDAPELVEQVRRELHRVRGTAGSYGFAEASRLSGVMEERAVRWAADARLEAGERSAMLLRYVAALAAAFEERVASEAEASTNARRLLAVDLPPAFASALAEEGRLRGYDVLVKGEGAWSPASLRQAHADVVAAPAGSAKAVHEAMGAARVPLVVLEDGSEPDVVRQAARLPGARVLTAADDPAAVFDMVVRAAGRTSWAGATVLACDDDPDVLALVRAIVEEAGMRVETLTDPARLMAELERVQPSLLLLDINIGAADGIALARTVRAVERFATLPLVIFSTQVDARTRERALAAGADEFLPKPIVASELRSRITVRLDAERLRLLDEGRHPGTGLLLADRTRAALGEHVARARTRGTPCSVALLRPAGPAPGGAALTAWHAEARRVAERLLAEDPTRVVGFSGDVAVAVVSDEPVEALVAAISAVAAQGTAAWHAGIAAAGPTLEAADGLLDAASDACGVAEQAGTRVHPWQPGDARLAPDVIVVEDDAALADMLRYALDTHGYSHRVFGTGTEAHAALVAMRPRAGRRPLVLLDVELPGLDGHSLHERLRVERPGTFAVVFATVHGSEGEQLRALRAGALDYIVKPVSLRVLMAKIPIWMAAAGDGRA